MGCANMGKIIRPNGEQFKFVNYRVPIQVYRSKGKGRGKRIKTAWKWKRALVRVAPTSK